MGFKFFTSLLLGTALILCSQLSFADQAERVSLHLQSQPQVSAGHTVIEFQLLDTTQGTAVGDAELAVSHEKKLHLIAYDPALKEFQHVHPAYDGTSWKADLDFAVDGNYFVWAQGELASDSTDFNALTRIEVSGGATAWPVPHLTDVRAGANTGSIATLSGAKLRAGKMAMLTLTFTRADGTPAEITPYLGAFAHVIATPEDGETLTHVHPMDGNMPNEGMLHLNFPTAGFYRIWVQFIDGGNLKVVPLSVQVF